MACRRSPVRARLAPLSRSPCCGGGFVVQGVARLGREARKVMLGEVWPINHWTVVRSRPDAMLHEQKDRRRARVYRLGGTRLSFLQRRHEADAQARPDAAGGGVRGARGSRRRLLAAIPGLRAWLLELIGHSGSPGTLPVLTRCLDDPDESVRSWAERGLRHLDTGEWRRMLWQTGRR